MPTQPTGYQLKYLTNALLDAFNHDELTRFTRHKLDISLEWITPVAGKRDLITITSNLVSYAASQQGGLKDLLSAVQDEVPTNAKLFALNDQWSKIDFDTIPLQDDHPYNISVDDVSNSTGISVGDVSNSTGIAIGHGAKADVTTIINQGEEVYNVSGLENPYLGLAAFTYENYARFAGRETEIDQAIKIITESDARFPLLLITGASGSGKSSFAHAGLMPKLEEYRQINNVNKPKWATIRPSSNPVERLEDALDRLQIDTTQLPIENPNKHRAEQISVLIIDQFEESFNQSKEEDRAKFFNILVRLYRCPEFQLYLIIIMRSDYLPEFSEIAGLHKIYRYASISLRVMTKEGLAKAIQQPAIALHRDKEKRFQQELLNRLIDDASEDPTYLPLLQVTLEELWRKGHLVGRSYRSLTDAIHDRADLVLNNRQDDRGITDHNTLNYSSVRSKDEKEAITKIFLSLVNVSSDNGVERLVRNPRPYLSLVEMGDENERLIQELVKTRLLSITFTDVPAPDNDNGSVGEQMVDVIHESLFSNWPYLGDAIKSEQKLLQRRHNFDQQLNKWIEYEKSKDRLLAGTELDEAQVLHDQDDVSLRNRNAKNFFDQSISERDRIKRRNRSITIGVLGALLTLLTVASIFGLLAYSQTETLTIQNQQLNERNDTIEKQSTQVALERNNAVSLQKTAEWNESLAVEARATAQAESAIARSRQLASQAINEVRSDNFELAILLAIESEKEAKTQESSNAIDSSLNLDWRTIVFYGHEGEVLDAIWSPDESKILTISSDKTIRVWNARTGKQLTILEGHQGRLVKVLWSKDGTKVVSLGTDLTPRIWDIATGDEIATLVGHTARINDIIWNKNETQIITVSSDKSVRIWNATSGIQLLELLDHEGHVISARWSPDESQILTASTDETAKIWRSDNGQQILELTGHTNRIEHALWNKEGTIVLTASADKTARVWDANSGQVLALLEGHTSEVTQASWNADETRILTVSEDKTARIWDTQTGNKLISLSGHTDGIIQAKWSHDETKVLTASKDKTVRIWDTQTGNELISLSGHTDRILQAKWSHDGSRVLTASEDNTARIWDARSGEELSTLVAHKANVLHSSWNQDETQVLTTSSDRTARIWLQNELQEFTMLPIDGGKIFQAIWSKDGSQVLTTDDKNTVNILDSISGEVLFSFIGHEGRVIEAIWSVDESKILTYSFDNTARIWDVNAEQQVATLIGHEEQILGALWSKSETKVITFSEDKIALIWDTSTGHELTSLVGHKGHIRYAVWNHDESQVLTVSDDKSARVWDANTGDELLLLNDHTEQIYPSAIWNKDESRILTSSQDGTAMIWDSSTGEKLVSFTGHEDDIYKAVWNQDESRVLTNSQDGTARIWDSETGRELVKFSGDQTNVYSILWNQDESKVLTSSQDGTARIWDSETGQELIAFEGHEDSILYATWNQDESNILTSSQDGTVRIWDSKTGQEINVLTGHQGDITANWNPNESRILTFSQDNTARIWYVSPCSKASRNFTKDEWHSFMDNFAYRTTCNNAPIPPNVVDETN